ncbi:hypothetical protein LTR78_000513 [Recurvomyces mirabilis]|uniref:Nucleoporin n=1 Tax=Recurvomyces mirabilis TaxID=574656 RepID=A0AAE1C6M4_9PEZI|nr:hypothetical protein LTR78_000513 [Recurvomyces mirabilis]KAK5162168.1 hypothetical protein LTS14_000514 [Recurvomyces mirabilis]
MESPLFRLQSLQGDLIAFSESRLSNVDRLSAELDASIDDLRRLLDKSRKSETSRKELMPNTSPIPETLKIGGLEYKVNTEFRQYAVKVADELDLDELEAAQLCLNVASDDAADEDLTMPDRAVLDFQHQRSAVLECMRLFLQQYNEIDDVDDPYVQELYQDAIGAILTSTSGPPDVGTELFRKCIKGLEEVETFLKRVADAKQTRLMTGSTSAGDLAGSAESQRLLLTRQHESLAAVLVLLLNGRFGITEIDYRQLITHATSVETTVDIAIHYIPIFVASAARFGAGLNTDLKVAKELHLLYASGPTQLRWRMLDLRAAATTIWLAGFSHRFVDPETETEVNVAKRQQAEQDRSDLFLQSVNDRALHFILAACKWLQPELWHDPAKVGLVQFLLENNQSVPPEAPAPASDFVTLTMNELQAFTEAFVSNMPDVVRRLKAEEDDRRRMKFTMPPTDASGYEPDMERFMLVMAYAYQDDPDSAEDFWSDKESNLYGFLRWVSQRLPTPRVAAFCELLTSVSSDEKSANHAHRFLLEDSTMVSGRLRKTYSVSWGQIFAELDTYASSLRDKPAAPQASNQDAQVNGADYIEGVETGIMLEAYLRLASHICRTSPEARNWLLREQPFHLGDIMFQLASSGIEGRLQASCFNMLAAMLTDKVTEVNDGMWVMLDNWISAGGPAGSKMTRPTTQAQGVVSEKQYLQRFGDRPETATAVVTLLNALVRPSSSPWNATLDALPFPENLGAPHRHAGIDAYVDFAIGIVFRRSLDYLSAGSEPDEISVLRYACLDFMVQALSTFNEDLLVLANATNIAVDATIRVSSLSTYAKLHPFARVMEWLFNNNVITALFATMQQDLTLLDSFGPGTPFYQATLRSVQVMNLAMKMQATYFDIVRPIIKTQSGTRATSVANAAFASFDDVMQSHISAVVDIAGYAASDHAELSLESLDLLQKLAASRKISGAADVGISSGRAGNRLISAFGNAGDDVASEIAPIFQISDIDIETGEQTLKVIKAQAVADMLVAGLDASPGRPTIAHCLLGLSCGERTVKVEPHGLFSRGQSLFHTIATCGVTTPTVIPPSNISWLLALKRSCLDIVHKLALSPLTSSLVQPELLSMDFLLALASSQVPVTAFPLFDSRACHDGDVLLETSASAIRDFLKCRELFFQHGTLQLRSASDQNAYSIQESTMSILCGTIRSDTGETESTASVFDLSDFMDLETSSTLGLAHRFLVGVDLSSCIKAGAEAGLAYDLNMAEQLLNFRKRELISSGSIKDPAEEQQLGDEIAATLASLLSENNLSAIQQTRLSSLESWTELVSLMMTAGGLQDRKLSDLALQGFQTVLPRYEKALTENPDFAALLAKLTLALVQPATAILNNSTETASTAHERLMAAFRISLKTLTESSTGLGLRDVCYRSCIAVIGCLPLQNTNNSKVSASPHARQLLVLVQNAGDRVLAVSTEDAFSGRGSTRVSAVLFLDALMAMSQAGAVNSNMLRALSKLNFVPVLIDTSIGSVASSFQAQNEELATMLAYFHTALALLLRICSTTDGTQLVLNSGFFSSISDSRLFSTDPDIGLDIDNPVALREFYKLLSAVLRVVTATVMTRGSGNATTVQLAKGFLQQNRFSIQAVFKRTSSVHRTSGPPEKEALHVAEEFSKLMLVTGFLDDDESSQQRTARLTGFT